MKRRTILTTVLILAAALLVLAPAVQARGLSCDCGCECRSPGYWKNHDWPVSGVCIGGTWYTEEQAVGIMNDKGKGDKTHTMFKALVAAKLDLASGCDGCIGWIVDAADDWMENHPVWSGVKGSDSAWDCGEWLYKKLDWWYNNNCSCYWCECCD
jgi:hypothetical protein